MTSKQATKAGTSTMETKAGTSTIETRAGTSLRSHLLRWLLIPLFVLWGADFWVTYERSIEQVNIGFDRTLTGSALMMSDRVQTRDGELTVDVPYAAFEMLESGLHDRIFYRVVDVSRNALLTGYEDLPLPDRLPAEGKPKYYDAVYRGEPLRVVALLRPVYDPDLRGPVLVLIGETTVARAALSHRMLLESATKELASIILVALLVWLAVRRSLGPLNTLQRQVAERADDDLTPIPAAQAPREVAPLIEAINLHTARQASMNEAQRAFVADASHQLKTPLTVLKAQAELALRQSDPAALREVVAQMLDSTDSTARVVQQLLSLARSDPGHTLESEDVDLAQLARDTTLELMPAALAKAIDLGYEGAASLRLDGHRILLHELLANLVDNAIRYTPPQGRITVRVNAGSAESGIVLQVEDDGPGIPAEQRLRVTERFYRPPGASGNGCGLGLSIAREICRRHDAALTFRDVAGAHGLLVEVCFPRPATS